MGFYLALNMGIQPVGALAAGGIAGAFGAPLAMFVSACGALIGLGSIGSWMFTHRTTSDLRLTAPEAEPLEDLDGQPSPAEISPERLPLREPAASSVRAG
jgi:hypothetical protein